MGGVSRARNEGLKKSVGTLVYFMDPDDWIENECFARCWETYLQSHADIIHFNYWVWRKGEKTQSPLKPQIIEGEDINREYAAQLAGYGGDALRYYYKHGNLGNYRKNGAVWHFMFLRSMLTTHGIVFPEGVKMLEDVIFVIEATIYANKIHCIKDTFYNYVVRESGALLSRVNDREKLFYDKYSLLPIRSRLRSMISTFDLHDHYLGSQVMSTLQLCLALSCSLRNYKKLATYAYDKRVVESFDKVPLDGAPLKFKLPVLLIKHKLAFLLFFLCWLARMCGLSGKMRM